MKFRETQVGQYVVPAFELERGEFVEIQLAAEWRPKDTEQLVEVLKTTANELSIGLATSLQWRFANWVDRLLRRRTDSVVVATGKFTSIEAREACVLCDLDPSTPFNRLTWTDRKMLDVALQLAAQDVVIVDDGGLDPLGETRLGTFLRSSLTKMNAAVIALRLPRQPTAWWTSTPFAISACDFPSP